MSAADVARQAAGQADEELAWTPAWRLREMFERRELSPLEFAQFLLVRVDRYAHYGAFITVFPELLLEQAKAATERFARGEPQGMLDGLPVSIKDTIFTKGLRTTLGSRAFADLTPDTDAVASERLKAANAIIFAKNNTPEFALNRRSFNLVSREALNPWDRTRTSGGSSGGAGVAAAAGLGPLAVGTDGGGSIRIPASFNGVFGVLPSRGRIPNGAGLYHAPTSGIGPMTRDVRDAATLFQVMACCDERDVRTMRTPPPDYLAQLEDGVTGLRMAWSADLGRVTPDDPAIPELCHEVAQTFAKLGAIYSEPDIRLEDPHDSMELDTEYSRLQVADWFRSLVPDYQDLLSWAWSLPPEKKKLLTIYILDRSDRPTALEYVLSIRPEVRYRPKTRLSDLFKDVDILMAPVIARTAFTCGDESVTPWQYTAYTHIANVSGYCAASVPAGFHNGMPIGLQLIARPGEEQLLFRAARALERERPWSQDRPPLEPPIE
ncbi:amidase [Phenylobacterium sp. LjRoot225]|uniref:amidase n=1 Tax=Phenylobacterium sp. LjRoot225 TaxID=3342285 RepID=UPI003ECEB3CE